MAVVKKYKARLTSIQSTIEGVYTLEFESMGSPFQYAPGQFLHLAIDTEYDGSGQWPESRCFSMQSNPSEKIIRITYAVKGAFTKAMEENLKIGSEVWLKLPYGDLFQQPHNKVNTVFIAGGTGITPFLSLFTHESFAEYINPKIYLGFRSEEFNIYQNELNRSTNATNILDVVYESNDGILDIHRIADKNSTLSSYFISGPPSMIKAFKQTLITRGVPVKNVLTDDWE
jgi:predicted ferric reductase